MQRFGPGLLLLLQLSYASLKLSDLGYFCSVLLLGGRFSILCTLLFSLQRLVLLFKLLYLRLHFLLVLLSYSELQLRMTVCRLLLFKSLVFLFELPDLVFHLSGFLGGGFFVGLGLADLILHVSDFLGCCLFLGLGLLAQLSGFGSLTLH